MFWLEHMKKVSPHWEMHFEDGGGVDFNSLFRKLWIFFDTVSNLASGGFLKINGSVESEMSMNFLNSGPLKPIIELLHTLNESFTHIRILYHCALSSGKHRFLNYTYVPNVNTAHYPITEKNHICHCILNPIWEKCNSLGGCLCSWYLI